MVPAQLVSEYLLLMCAAPTLAELWQCALIRSCGHHAIHNHHAVDALIRCEPHATQQRATTWVRHTEQLACTCAT